MRSNGLYHGLHFTDVFKDQDSSFMLYGRVFRPVLLVLYPYNRIGLLILTYSPIARV